MRLYGWLEKAARGLEAEDYTHGFHVRVLISVSLVMNTDIPYDPTGIRRGRPKGHNYGEIQVLYALEGVCDMVSSLTAVRKTFFL